jgi:ARG/rhodanese/phosphatase superfamily protein
MKAWTSFAICALLVIVTVCPTGEVEASGSAPIKSPMALIAPGQHWRLSQAVKFENLTIFPVLTTVTTSIHRYITLDDGLRSGKVVISEIGSGGRSRRIRAGSLASDDAEVNRLLLTNSSGKTLILIAGEIVVGGKQDRIVGHDCLVASTGKPVPIDVFCVEHGRWNEDSAFGQSRSDGMGAGRGVVARGRGRRGGIGVGSGRGSGHGRGARGGGMGVGVGAGSGPAGVNVSGGTAVVFEAAATVMAAPNIREKAQAYKDQGAVWSEVAKAQQANNVSSSTGTLNSVFQDKQVQSNLNAYERALGKALPKTAVGAIAAINGTIVSADVFASPALFRSYWPKLLRSFALQASSTEARGAAGPSLAAAEAFLARTAAESANQESNRLYRLIERKSDSGASFELESAPSRQRVLLHFNKVAKS